MAVKHLSDKNPDGTLLGQDSADLIAFWGASPAARASLTTLATGATIATVVTSVQQVITHLRNLGLAG